MRQYFMLLLVSLLVGCSTSTPPDVSGPDAEIVVTGVVKPLQVSSWQYGSHLLVNRQSGDRYALTSDSVALDRYVESGPVTVYGSFVDGYPVDGGPPYIRVTTVRTP